MNRGHNWEFDDQSARESSVLETVSAIASHLGKEGRLGTTCLEGNGIGTRNKCRVTIYLSCNTKYIDKLERNTEKKQTLVV